MNPRYDDLTAWYRASARDLPWRRTRDPYALWVSEVMLQQTRVDTVIPYYLRFLGAFPTVRALAEADEETVLSLWQGLGYYRRARMLHAGARAVRALGGLPSSRDALLGLPGIGAYTAGAIASIAFGERVSAVDGNVRRVAARWEAYGGPVDRPPGSKRIDAVAAEWAAAAEEPGIWNQALMELGARVCVPGRPDCAHCPVLAACAAAARGCAAELPILTPKAAPISEDVAIAVAVCAGRVLMLRRPEEGMLARMWGFPMVPCGDDVSLAGLLREMGLTVRLERRLCDARHRFTHRIWHMSGWLYTAEETAPVEEGWWMTRVELDAAPIPTAVRAYRDAVRSLLLSETAPFESAEGVRGGAGGPTLPDAGTLVEQRRRV